MAESSNPSDSGNTNVAAVETTRDRNDDTRPEPAEDRRPFGFGPCIVCNTNKVCVIFNCGHLICCHRCANERFLCPRCGRTVTERRHVYEPS